MPCPIPAGCLQTVLMPAVPDPETLLAAVRGFRSDGLELVVRPEAADAVHSSLSAGLLLLGEVHGVLENPQIIFALMRRFGIGGLALEWPASVSNVVAAWRQGGPLPLDDQLWWGDGRVTAGHFALLRDLPTVPTRLFDLDFLPAGATWSDRDAAMAKAISQFPAVPNGWLVVAGNAHTAMKLTDLGTPMGYTLSSGRPQLQSIEIFYGSGTFYNAGRRRFSEYSAARGRFRRPLAGPALLQLAGGGLRLTLPRAHEADVPHRSASNH
jgi:hypothetical protein